MAYPCEEQVTSGWFTAPVLEMAPLLKTAPVRTRPPAPGRVRDGAAHAQVSADWRIQSARRLAALDEIGPLSPGSVLLGLGTGRLPVLFNLNDPAPGAFLILGDALSGKTDLLLSLLQSAALLNPGSVSLALISAQHYNASRFGVPAENLELWRPYQPEAQSTIEKLVRLAQRRLEGRPGGPAVLLGIDDLDLLFASLAERARSAFFWLVRNGAAARIWTLATLSSRPGTRAVLESGLQDAFPTLLLGRLENPDQAAGLTGGDDLPCSLLPGVEFCLSAGRKSGRSETGRSSTGRSITGGQISLQRASAAAPGGARRWMRFTILRHSLE